MTRLQGKTAIITGGARGMGEATTRLFVEHGGKVVIADVLDEQGEKLAAELGDSAVFVHTDVSREDHWAVAVDAAQQLGTLNVLVNNAAIMRMIALTETSVDDYMQIIGVNQLGTFLGMKAVVDSMKSAGCGSIINVSSIDGLHSQAGLTAYSASKWAVRGMTKAAAIELGQYNIRVNSVHPGGMYTQMGGSEHMTEEQLNQSVYKDFPIPRVGQPEEVANVIVFLATDEASYSTGSEFVADGGWFTGMRRPGVPCS